jgi:hypothetical protein
MTSTNDLSTPLLGKISQRERDVDDDQEEGCMMCALKIVYDDEESEDCESSSNDGQSKFSRWFEIVVVEAALPALLFMQFGMAFSRSPVDDSTAGLRWSLCNYSIVLFVITAFHYRQHVYVFKPPCSKFLILLPEIFMNIILILLLFDKIVAAFWLLLGSMHSMAALVLGNSIRVLVVTIFY